MKFDLEGEERFGRITSWLYAFFADHSDGFSMWKFAADDILDSGRRIILDVGTGPGNIPFMLADKGKGLEIYAIDPSKAMLRIARKKCAGKKVTLAEGYSRYVPFHKKFDLIISTVSFHHWTHKNESLIYLSKFLKPGGEIRIYEFRKVPHLFIEEKHSMTREELVKAGEEAGLRVKNIAERKGKLRASYERRLSGA